MLNYILFTILAPVLVYVFSRLITFAFFKSKEEYLHRLLKPKTEFKN